MTNQPEKVPSARLAHKVSPKQKTKQIKRLLKNKHGWLGSTQAVEYQMVRSNKRSHKSVCHTAAHICRAVTAQ